MNLDSQKIEYFAVYRKHNIFVIFNTERYVDNFDWSTCVQSNKSTGF